MKTTTECCFNCSISPVAVKQGHFKIRLSIEKRLSKHSRTKKSEHQSTSSDIVRESFTLAVVKFKTWSEKMVTKRFPERAFSFVRAK